METKKKLKNYRNYFIWDYAARDDIKMRKLLRIESMAGYGICLVIIELIYEMGGEVDLDTILFEFKRYSDVDEEKVISILNNYDLFTKTNNNIYSNERVKKAIQDRIIASERKRKGGIASGESRRKNKLL